MSLFTAADLPRFRADRLLVAAQTHLSDACLSDGYLLGQIQAAEADIARRLRVFLEPTQIFPYEPTEEEVTALDGMPYVEDPGQDYDTSFFQGDRWGYIVTRHHPVVSVESIKMIYPNPQSTFFTFPKDWERIDKKYGHIRLVPASAAFNAPLNAFMMQAMGGGGILPSAIAVKYVAGLKDVRTDPTWADLVDIILKAAVLRLIEGAFSPQSGSISSDGLSQSMSIDMEKYRDIITTALTGPKGSNGGFWVSIHGMGLGVLGVTV